MKLIYLGDFIKGNGPSQVDINLCKNFKNINLIKNQIDKKIRLEELFNIFSSDNIIISGVSFKGVIFSIISKIFNKQILYIMHGSLQIEKKYRKILKTRFFFEYLQLKLSDKIVCVSEKFSLDVKKIYTKFENKIIYINNGINKIKINPNLKKSNTLVTLGGGRKEKGVLQVCEAIESLMKDDNFIEKVIVIGEDGTEKDKICKYKFVEWKGFISNEEVNMELNKSKYFIQNSFYESFGIAPFEAITQGCKIVISEEVPIVYVMKLDKKYVCNPYDIEDIKNKLKNLKFQTEKFDDLNFEDWDKIAEKYLELLKR